MKILLTTNKTYRGVLDGGWWNFYIPLADMGHDMCFYDTVEGGEKTFKQTVETFKPDLIFCIMTGDKSIAPKEPWEEISMETKSGRTKTYNWFCDDSWRYDSFSKNACTFFHVCSTTERSRIKDYKQDSYNNIFLTNWHVHSKFFKTKTYLNKSIDMSFIGYLTEIRKVFFNKTDLPITFFNKITQKELFAAHCETKIGISLSRNDNDPYKKTQMKQRIFEVPAGGGLLLTEYHEGIEDYFKIDKEIVTFKSILEFKKKANFLLHNPKISEKIAIEGHKRSLREHDSKIRLQEVLNNIKNL